MTDKEIIIDGVDVSGCEYCSSTPNSTLCYMKGNKCEDNPNCNYKQLQRLTTQYDKVLEQNKSLQAELKQKEQEYEKLENSFLELTQYFKFDGHHPKNFEELKICINGTNEELVKLQQECEELKEKLKTAKMDVLIDYISRHIKCVLPDNCGFVNRYKQALDEIENFMIYEFSGQNEWVKTSVLDIINKTKEVHNGKTEQM